MALFVYLVFLLALTDHSSALYCLCKDNVGDQILQKAIDYACGFGADCAPIQPNAACYQPNTMKDHCNYAVNSYYQKKGNAPGSCDFGGAATTSPNPPTTSSGCVYPSSSSSAGPPPSTGSPPSIGSPGTQPSPGSSGTPPATSSPNATTGHSNSGTNLKVTNFKMLLLFVLPLWLAIKV